MTTAISESLALATPVNQLGFRATWLGLAVLLIAAGAGLGSLLFVLTNVDAAWLLVACYRLLDGARLHVDLIEVNPPFSIGYICHSLLLHR